MKKLAFFVLLWLAFAKASHANEQWLGYCTLQASFTRVTSCTVEVYVSGTTTDAVIYSDNIGTVLSNPFTASPTTGIISFYAANGRYDIRLSGGSPSISPAYTIPDQLLLDFGAAFTQSLLPATDAFYDVGSASFRWNNGYFVNIQGDVVFPGNPQFTGTVSFTNPLSASAFQSTTANPAATGVLRLACSDSIAWRNAANTADITITPQCSDILNASSGIVAPYFGDSNIFVSPNASSGLYRLTSGDGICWRNNANNADACITKNPSDLLIYGGSQIAVTNLSLSWAGTQTFQNIQWTAGGAGLGVLSHSNTGTQTYTFPNATGTVALLNIAQSFTAVQNFTSFVIGASSTITGTTGNGISLETAGVNSGVTGALLCNDAAGNATTSSCTLPVNGPFSRTTTVSNSTIPTGSPVTVMSTSVTIPTTGGPFRIFAQPNILIKGSNTTSGADCWISDGTNTWDFYEILSGVGMLNSIFAYGESVLSPVTYAAGAGSKTISIICQANNGSTMSVVSATVGPGVPNLSAEVLQSN